MSALSDPLWVLKRDVTVLLVNIPDGKLSDPLWVLKRKRIVV